MNTWSPAEFIGGHPALDFLNTVNDTGKSRNQSKIADWASFTGWCVESKMFNSAQLDSIAGTTFPSAHDPLLNKVHIIREHAYCAFTAIIDGDEKALDAIAPLQEELLVAMSRAKLSVEHGQTYWSVNSENNLWLEDAFALSIDDLMRSEGFPKIRQCGRCTWLFLDKGRGRGRRWCTMSKCGNREKTKRFRSQPHLS